MGNKDDEGEQKGEKNKGEGEEKIMTEKVATNIIASQPPEWRPTASPTAFKNLDK